MHPYKIAIVGDVHLQFDEEDVAWLNSSAEQVILFVGDFVARDPDGLFKMLPLINALTKPVYIIPGNHDTTGLIQLTGEILHNDFLSALGTSSQQERLEKFRSGLSRAVLCGYSRHELLPGLGLVAARPFSMGGGLNFKKILRELYNIHSLEDSTAAIVREMEQVQTPYLLLAHHGPFGLGTQATDIFGADFLPNAGDWGDKDLSAAIRESMVRHCLPLAVIAGHMHYPTKHGKLPRRWFTHENGILYLNAARWPRIFRHGGKLWHHYVRLQINEANNCQVTACYWSGGELCEIADPLRCWP